MFVNKSNYYSTNTAFSTIGVYRAKTWYPLYEFSSFPPLLYEYPALRERISLQR